MKKPNMPDAQIILASGSPRRRELLDQIGVCYRACSADIDETILAHEDAAGFAARMAREKAEAIGVQDGLPVLGADTVVVIGEQVLGKPDSRAGAEAMLAQLSGHQHRVITAVAVLTPAGDLLSDSNTTRVTFRELTATEIETYCDTGDPMDKAGAYGVQGLAAMFISHLQGSQSGVMGLPLFETSRLLQKAGVSVPSD